MTVETEIKYAGYIDQQRRQIRAHAEFRYASSIPETMAFTGIPGISREIAEKLNRVRPATLGQAAIRIPGVTPAAVALLDVYMSLASRAELAKQS